MEWTDPELQRIRDYHHVFGTETGQRVLDDIKRSFYFYKTTFVPGDPHATSRNEGMREVALLIERLLQQETSVPAMSRAAHYDEE